jgi:hypothetical protein
MSLSETSSPFREAEAWCSSYGDGKWYLPNINTLKTIDSNKSKLNATLTEVGGTTLGTRYDYWSSTVDDVYGYAYGTYMVLFSFESGSSSSMAGYIKSTYHVRAVRAL